MARASNQRHVCVKMGTSDSFFSLCSCFFLYFIWSEKQYETIVIKMVALSVCDSTMFKWFYSFYPTTTKATQPEKQRDEPHSLLYRERKLEKKICSRQRIFIAWCFYNSRFFHFFFPSFSLHFACSSSLHWFFFLPHGCENTRSDFLFFVCYYFLQKTENDEKE